MKKSFATIYGGLSLTALFKEVVNTPLMRAFADYCKAKDPLEKRKAYAAFVAEIYEGGGDLTSLLQRLIFEDENVYVRTVALGKAVGEHIERSAKRELTCFAEIAALTVADFAEDMGIDEGALPAFSSEPADIYGGYQRRLASLDKYGYGIFSSRAMFRLTDERALQPIVSADKISMAQFIGYETEREKIVQNTHAFLQGRPAANALLCGDAGTGKSSTVKAVVNAFFEEGLRLIELRKDQLRYLPLVMAKISGNPLKFIIFIDDLSFNKNNDDFSMLKAALEGSASARAENALIYATSNRRHIIKESFGDREGDDIHRNDTMQETLSLAERFGLTVLFSKPSKALYLTIVKELARRYGVQLEEKELELQAEAFALRKGNRSARCAEQFINSLR